MGQVHDAGWKQREKAKEQDLWARNRTDVRRDLLYEVFLHKKASRKLDQRKNQENRAIDQ